MWSANARRTRQQVPCDVVEAGGVGGVDPTGGRGQLASHCLTATHSQSPVTGRQHNTQSVWQMLQFSQAATTSSLANTSEHNQWNNQKNVLTALCLNVRKVFKNICSIY